MKRKLINTGWIIVCLIGCVMSYLQMREESLYVNKKYSGIDSYTKRERTANLAMSITSWVGFFVCVSFEYFDKHESEPASW